MPLEIVKLLNMKFKCKPFCDFNQRKKSRALVILGYTVINQHTLCVYIPLNFLHQPLIFDFNAKLHSYVHPHYITPCLQFLLNYFGR